MKNGQRPMEPISRRTTLKAGAHAAWAVPAISLATTAPAFAASGDDVQLVLDNFSAAYNSDFSGNRPDQLVASFSLRNDGTATATGVTITFTIPSGLFASPPSVASPPAGWASGTPSGSLAAGWTFVWSRAADLGWGETTGPQVFSIQFNDPLTVSPYRRWAGEPFAASATVQAVNSPTPSAQSVNVTAGPLTYFVMEGYGGTYLGSQVTLRVNAFNFGRSSSRPTKVAFWFNPEGGDDPAWTTQPLSATWSLDGFTEPAVITGGGTSGADPWYLTFDGPPTATRASYEAQATDEEVATTKIAGLVKIELATAPTTVPTRDFYMTIRADDAQEPVENGFGWKSTVVVPDTGEVRPHK